MAATIPRITATNQWQSANALTGIASGTALKLQHIGGMFVNIVLAAVEPTSQDNSEGEQIKAGKFFAVEAGEAEVWLKVASPLDGLTALLSVQENA